MIQIKTTPNLYGISLQGDYPDLNELYDSISRYLSLYMTRMADFYPYHEYEYLLSLNYDIRHAYMGTRGVEIVENNASAVGVQAENIFQLPDESQKEFQAVRNKHKKGNLYFSVEILYPLVFHYLIAFENILADEIDETWFVWDPKPQERWLEEYTLLDAACDRSQISLFNVKLWKNIQELLGAEKAKELYNYYQNSEPLYPNSVYCDALLHYQLGIYPRLNLQGRKAFLELCLYEILESDYLLDYPGEFQESYKNYKRCLKELKKQREIPDFPLKDDFYMKLEQHFKPGTPMYRDDFDEFLTKNYGVSEDKEPEW